MKCAKFIYQPCHSHLMAAKRILRYVKATPNNGLLLTEPSDERLLSNFDADWPSCPDDKRSTSGLCIYFRPNLITWASKKQPIVSCSSAEAEYLAMASPQ